MEHFVVTCWNKTKLYSQSQPPIKQLREEESPDNSLQSIFADDLLIIRDQRSVISNFTSESPVASFEVQIGAYTYCGISSRLWFTHLNLLPYQLLQTIGYGQNADESIFIIFN